MTEKVSIRIPSETVTPQQFADLEGIKRRTVYSWCAKGLLPIRPKNKKSPKGPTTIYYVKYKRNKMAESLGHSNFEILIGH